MIPHFRPSLYIHIFTVKILDKIEKGFFRTPKGAWRYDNSFQSYLILEMSKNVSWRVVYIYYTK